MACARTRASRCADQGRRGLGELPDVLMLSAGYQHKPELPFIPGMEGAGTVTAVGAEVKELEARRQVDFRRAAGRHGGICPRAGQRQPDADAQDWSWAEGAAFRIGATTAYLPLFNT